MSSPDSEVAEFFRGRSIFVTGASGFMGKVLLEKLLYSCTDLRIIYVLMRSKRNKTPEQRAEEMFKIPVSFRFYCFLVRRSAVLGFPSLPCNFLLAPRDHCRFIRFKIPVHISNPIQRFC
jgi:hypothetical protein